MKKSASKRELRKQLAEANKVNGEWAEEYTKARDALKKLLRFVQDAIKELEK